ncbi:glycosyltransferase family 2 protein [Luteibacter sp. CQ10]|uniref:glycosyltransferase family 2 protein n=1 Tax=Luteibacter sp. CQ10 TaxID=2805821 RepID=UPI0034A42AF5
MPHPVHVSLVSREVGHASQARVTRCTVAIPVRNEAERIHSCLGALHDQRLPTDGFELLLVLNGCTDASWHRALDVLSHWRRPWRMVECVLPMGLDHAGGARAAALGMALERGTPAVLTTDADSLVGPDWVALNLAALDHGDVVAGDVDIRDDERLALPAHLIERQRLEATYGALLDEIEACCDPLDHDPWPNHRTRSGASLGFRADALRRLPSLPAPPCGEDRALVAALAAHGARIRHDTRIRVGTSPRLAGRARGGMADTLRYRIRRQNARCDPMLEAAHRLVVRASLRARARTVFESGMPPHHLAVHLGLVPGRLTDEPCIHFERAWQWIEANVSALARRPLSPAALPSQIDLARDWLRRTAEASSRREVAA